MKLEVAGEPIHTRCLGIALKQAAGGLVDFRADILDLRKGGLMELAGRVTMAGIIHKMELTGAFEADSGRLERIEWAQSHVMQEPSASSRGESCRDPMPRLNGVLGARFGSDFAAELKGCFGGPLGCTHVNTLLQEVDAFVSLHLARRRDDRAYAKPRDTGERIGARSLYFDAFFREGGATTDLSVRLADLHYAPCGANGREVVSLHAEVRLLAEADLAGWQLRALAAKERERLGPTCGDAAWTPRTTDLEGFVGRSLYGGMNRFCLERFGGRKADARLLSALMSLAPGMTQVGAAVSDRLTPSTSARPLASGLSGPGPCFMLRADGPLMESIRMRTPEPEGAASPSAIASPSPPPSPSPSATQRSRS